MLSFKHFLKGRCLLLATIIFFNGNAQSPYIKVIVIKDSIFRDSILFPKTLRNREFENVTFCKAIYLENLKGTTGFQNSKFLDGATFSENNEFENALIVKSFFGGDVYFQSSLFRSNAFFVQDTFANPVYFTPRFLGPVSFNESIFFSTVAFSSSVVYGLSFPATRFKQKCTFTNLFLVDSGYIDFRGAIFPDTIDFSSNSKIHSNVDFTVGDFTDSSRYDYKTREIKPIWILLYNTDISKIKLDYTHFRLLLPDSTDGYLSARYVSADDKAIIYEALLNNFKTHGQQDSYEPLDIEYKTFRWKHSWARWFVWLPKYWWNFGYAKQYIFLWTFSLLASFTIVTYFFLYSLNMAVYPMKKIPSNEHWKKRISLNDFKMRLWYSFIYTGNIFFRLTLKVDEIDFSKKRGTAYLMFVYTLGLICIAYMVNFIVQH